jgi:thiosulfate sulfurtransferase
MNPFKEISVEQAAQMHQVGKAIFLDIRDPRSFESSHVPGALPLNDSNAQDFVTKTDKTKPIVCYCYHGHTSQGVAAYLADQGFEEVYSVIGGFEDWRQTEKTES